jgi:hypothetical protein
VNTLAATLDEVRFDETELVVLAVPSRAYAEVCDILGGRSLDELIAGLVGRRPTAE